MMYSSPFIVSDSLKIGFNERKPVIEAINEIMIKTRRIENIGVKPVFIRLKEGEIM